MTKSFPSNRDYPLWFIMTVILEIQSLSNRPQRPQRQDYEDLLSLAERQAFEYFKKEDDTMTSSDDFYIKSRLLQLRAEMSNDDETAAPKKLLEHFSSSTTREGDDWCDKNLGFELWRREVELKHGTVERGEWKRSWDRMKQSLVQKRSVFFFLRGLRGVLFLRKIGT